jgi:hypothetical protein
LALATASLNFFTMALMFLRFSIFGRQLAQGLEAHEDHQDGQPLLVSCQGQQGRNILAQPDGADENTDTEGEAHRPGHPPLHDGITIK